MVEILYSRHCYSMKVRQMTTSTVPALPAFSLQRAVSSAIQTKARIIIRYLPLTARCGNIMMISEVPC